MLEKRKYFISNQQQYQFSTVKTNSYLYIYKHNIPQIIVRFIQPRKTITGYDFKHAQIMYHPFYQEFQEQSLQISRQIIITDRFSSQRFNHNKKPSKIQKFIITYKGQIIVNKQSEIFNQFFKRQVQSIINQSKNPPVKSNKFLNTKNQIIKISQVFQILLDQWLNEQQINAIFLVTQKHQKSFTAYDHGFMQLEVLKTSQSNMKIEFYTTKKANKVISDNKKYFFEYQSSILYKIDEDYSDVQKLGFMMPTPLSMNEFFFECLIMMFAQFEEEQKKKSDKIRRQQQMLRIKQTLLDNFRKMGVQPKITDTRNINKQFPQEVKQDQFDKRLNELTRKKKLNKNQQVNKSPQKFQNTINENMVSFQYAKSRRQSLFSSSPQKRQQTFNRGSQQRQIRQRQSPPRYRKMSNIKVIRSFTSELLDDEFEEKQKRRFITRAQYDKILQFNQRVIAKKQAKQLQKLDELNQDYDLRQKLKHKKEEVVYVGVKQLPAKLTSRTSNKGSHNRARIQDTFVFDYFSVQKQMNTLNRNDVDNDKVGTDKFSEQNQNLIDRLKNSQIKDEQAQEISLPGFGDISIIIKKKEGIKMNQKTQNLQFMQQNSYSGDYQDY